MKHRIARMGSSLLHGLTCRVASLGATLGLAVVGAVLLAACSASDPLPSWNDTDTKRAIVAFVESVSDESSPDFVPKPERIATFDNDGCLWAEQPAYFQLLFAMDRVKALAPNHPGWADREPYKSAIAGDLKAVAAQGTPALMELVMASHADMTAEEFAGSVALWLASARHPTLDRPYTELVYQPQLELLDYLRDHGFKTFIVSGGGVDFVRVWAEAVYGIPPEQVVGSRIKAEYAEQDGQAAIVKLPEVDLINDKAGKPVGIHQHIGRRPVFAAGNSDGDLQMLQYTAAGDGPRFCLIVHHTDAEREWAYDRDSHIGKLDAALDQAHAKGWTVVDMATDWNVVFPPSAVGVE
ncbi:MAG: HAD family hydrolase [Planctomycetota bacterium]